MTNYSFWEEDVFLAPCDVLIAGAGFAGLWSAFHLKQAQPELKISIIDKQLVPLGASTRNAGFACFGSLTELKDDIEEMGEEETMNVVKMRYDGLQTIRQTFTAEEINFEQNGGYELISPGQFTNLQALADEIARLNDMLSRRLRLPDVFKLANEKIFHFGFAGTAHLIENSYEGQLHPGKLLRALQQKVISLGVQVLRGIEVTGYETLSNSLAVSTSLGREIIAEKLLIATNAFSHELHPALHTEAARGQVLLTSPIPGLTWQGSFHYDEGFYYFRNLGDRILLGGARNKNFAAEKSTEPVVTGEIQTELERFLKDVILPGKAFSIESRWSGIMGMGESKIPVIRALEPRVISAAGLGGIGIAVAPMVGKKAAALLRSEVD